MLCIVPRGFTRQIHFKYINKPPGRPENLMKGLNFKSGRSQLVEKEQIGGHDEKLAN